MKILMIDVGGTNVKLMASGQEGRRKIPSGKTLTGPQMVKEVIKAAQDWEYDAITIGYPSQVINGKPARQPFNLGNGWVNFNYRKAFRRPVRFINDAAMQALASYDKGRMLFIGFGTSTGATLISDDVILPFEIGMLRLTRTEHFMDRLSNEALQRTGLKRWLASAHDAIEIMRDMFKPDDIVIGGGNGKKIEPMPKGCRHRDNQAAFAGATRLWPGADMLAEPYGASWRIRKRVGNRLVHATKMARQQSLPKK